MKRRGDSLLFPIAKYLIISRSDLVTAFRSDHFNNIFNIEGTKKLSIKDTLLVQQFELAMIKGSE